MNVNRLKGKRMLGLCLLLLCMAAVPAAWAEAVLLVPQSATGDPLPAAKITFTDSSAWKDMIELWLKGEPNTKVRLSLYLSEDTGRTHAIQELTVDLNGSGEGKATFEGLGQGTYVVDAVYTDGTHTGSDTYTSEPIVLSEETGTDGGNEDGDGDDVIIITPPGQDGSGSGSGNEGTGEDGQTPTTANPFHVEVVPGEGSLEVDVWGGSALEITVTLTKPDGSTDSRTLQNGGGLIQFDNLAAGRYQVYVNYTTPVEGVDAYLKTADVPAAYTPEPPANTYRQIEATADAQGDTITVIVTEAYEEAELYVTLTNSAGSVVDSRKINNATSGPGPVEFTGLPAGTYTVVVGYTAVQEYARVIPNLIVSDSAIVATAAAEQRQITVNVMTADRAVTVSLLQNGSAVATRSIEAGVGSVTFDNLSAGLYSVSVDYTQGSTGSPIVIENLQVTEQARPISITQVTGGENRLVVTGTAQPGTDITLTTEPASATAIVRSDANGLFTASLVCGAGTYTAVHAQYGSDSATRVTASGSFVVTAPASKPTLTVDPVTPSSSTVVAKTTPGVVVNLATSDFGQTVTADSRGILRFSLPHTYAKGTVLTFTVYYGENNVNSFTQTATVGSAIHYNLLKKGMVGDDVYALTARLSELGYPVSPTRTYSDTVVAAVRLFQKNNGLSVDGMAGELTQSALYSVCAIAYNESDTVYPTLVRGDKGLALIYTLQQRLKDLGYYTIKVDGIFGSGTQRAVRWFQQVNGLTVTGVADNVTQKLLYSSAAKAATGYDPGSGTYETLSRSSRYNAAVVPLQRRLKSLGYYSGSVDGYFGSQTYRAVRNFQSRNGLTVTGVADPYTQDVLYSSSAKRASGSSSSGSSSGYSLLSWGSSGSAVRKLQQTLLDLGYTQIRTVDGIYGQWTYDAVRAFQKNEGLAVDGIAGVNTLTALYGSNPAPATTLQVTSLTDGTATQEQMRVDFYNVGKADAMLITTPNGGHILIDAATDDGGDVLVNELRKAGVTRIDMMIITHFDKDHVGGADKVVENFTVSRVVMPRYEKDSNQYTEFTEALAASTDTQVIYLEARQILEIAFGDVQLRVSAANETDYGEDEENDFSLATRVTYGQTRFLFAGDAEDARQTELLAEGDLACDVLKVPYHGRLVNASSAFLTACSPKIAFITDSEEEPADTLLLEQLRALGTQVYCAKDGGIAVTSDGTNVQAVPYTQTGTTL